MNYKNIFSAMLTFLALILLISILYPANAGTCSSISRTNFSPNTVLRSSELNSQFNVAYSAVNAFDGGCVTDGTLEAGALNTTEFNPQLNAIKRGCKVTRSDAATMSVGACRATVNGNSVAKTSATTVTWGCTNCSSEASSTVYYLYIATGSSGSTLNLLITTTAPNDDGYDNSGNFILASFFNNSASDIDDASIREWNDGKFGSAEQAAIAYGETKPVLCSGIIAAGSVTTACSSGTCTIYREIGDCISSVGWNSTGNYTINYSTTRIDAANFTCTFQVYRNAAAPRGLLLERPPSGADVLTTYDNANSSEDNVWGYVCLGEGRF